jgi:hypothetical protein
MPKLSTTPITLMNMHDWTVDMTQNTLTHNSGFTIRFEGDPKDPSEIYPEKFPQDMSFIDQAQLLRAGLEFLAKFASSSTWRPTQPIKSEAVKAREELAKQFAERPDKPQRSVLSLKK